jgi:hypothetical protein
MGCREEKILTTRKKYIKYTFFYKGYFMSSFPSLSQKLDEVATACAFAAAYSPREILDVLESIVFLIFNHTFLY